MWHYIVAPNSAYILRNVCGWQISWSTAFLPIFIVPQWSTSGFLRTILPPPTGLILFLVASFRCFNTLKDGEVREQGKALRSERRNRPRLISGRLADDAEAVLVGNSLFAFILIDKSVLLENRPLEKFIGNYVRDSRSVFSISSTVWMSMTLFSARTVVCTQFAKC